MWIIFQMIWIAIFKFDFQGESDKYIREANLFITNNGFTQQRFIFYATTILIIVFSTLSKIGLYGAIAIIMVINLACYLYFFKALKTVFVKPVYAYLVILFLLTFWPYQRWSITLYSEALFYSFVMLLFSILILYRSLSAKYLLTLFTILGLLILTRPMGVLFVIPVLAFIYFHLLGKQKIYFLLSLILAAFLLNYVVQIVFTTTSDWSMTAALQSDIIVADKEDMPVNKNIILSNSSNQLYQLFYYITNNFFHFIGLAAKRLQAFFFLFRSYYSVAHNIFLIGPVILIYVLIFIRFNRISKALGKPLLFFMISSILFFAMAVALQFDDYHNRFFLVLMPIFTVMATVGLFYKNIRLAK